MMIGGSAAHVQFGRVVITLRSRCCELEIRSHGGRTACGSDSNSVGLRSAIWRCCQSIGLKTRTERTADQVILVLLIARTRYRSVRWRCGFSGLSSFVAMIVRFKRDALSSRRGAAAGTFRYSTSVHFRSAQVLPM